MIDIVVVAPKTRRAHRLRVCRGLPL